MVWLRPTRFLLGVIAAGAIGSRPAVASDGDGTPSAVTDKLMATFGQPPEPKPQLEVQLRPLKPPQRGPLSGGGLMVPIGESLATHLVMVEWSRHVGSASWADVSADSVGRNLRSAWVLDDDDFWVNQIGHTYQGTLSFTAARSSGLGFWASVPFPVVSSALWEIAGETTRPSINDQITTSVAGVAIGEILYRFAGALRAEGGGLNEAFATVLAPMSTLNRELLGKPQTIRAPPSRWQLNVGAAGYTMPDPSNAQPFGYGGLSFTYGVPGSDGLEIGRPFDHFAVDFGITAAPTPVVSVFTRGLLAGRAFDDERASGLWGAYLSFDFDSPPRERISTSAVGFGGSARAELRGGLAVEGDAIASAVLLGAGGKTASHPAGRDYRYGPGEQVLLGVRLLAGSRVTAGVALRQYLLFGAGADTGMEHQLHGTASATFRLFGANGMGLELSRYLRRAEVEGATVREGDSAVRVYFVHRGGV